MKLSEELDELRSWLDEIGHKIAELESENQQLKKEIQLLLTGSTEFVDKEG